MKSYDIVLKEKSLDEGLTRDEMTCLIDMLHAEQSIPMEIQGEFSVAMGFIDVIAAYMLDYDYEGSGFVEYVTSIMNDMNLEHDDGCYSFEFRGQEFNVYLSR